MRTEPKLTNKIYKESQVNCSFWSILKTLNPVKFYKIPRFLKHVWFQFQIVGQRGRNILLLILAVFEF